MSPIIETPRLRLVSLSLEFMRAAERGDTAEVNALLGAEYPPDLLAHQQLYMYRRKQLEANPDVQSWLLRAVFLRDTLTIVGRIGFHAEPHGGVAEFGYEICPAFRRRGYAEEAIRAMMRCAAEQGVTRFIASISPANHPSLKLAHKFGFIKIGEQMDEIDGPEDIFELVP